MQTISAGLYLLVATFTMITPVSAREPTPAYDASRLVSIGGDITEILYLLGAEKRIVAVDTTSQHPASALAEKPNVGYLRQLSTEGVLSLAPTLILASERAGPPAVVAALRRSSARVVLIPDVHSQTGVVEKVRLIADAIGQGDAGAEHAQRITRAFAEVAAIKNRIENPIRALFVLSADGGRIMVGGQDTSAAAIFSLAGVTNAAHGISGFKPIGEEALIEMAPDVVFVMRRSRPGAPSGEALERLPGYKLTPAGAAQRLYEVDGLLMLGFGPRTPQALRDIIAFAYPALLPRVSR